MQDGVSYFGEAQVERAPLLRGTMSKLISRT